MRLEELNKIARNKRFKNHAMRLVLALCKDSETEDDWLEKYSTLEYWTKDITNKQDRHDFVFDVHHYAVQTNVLNVPINFKGMADWAFINLFNRWYD